MTPFLLPPSAPSRIAAVMLAFSLALIPVPSALATSGTWNGTNSGAWSDAGNWSASPAPTTADTATFNGAGNTNTTLTIDSGRTVKTINFDTSAVAYTLGASGANAGNTLTLASTGGVSLLSSLTTSATQTFNAPISLGGSVTLTNATTSGAKLVFAGDITNTATSTITLAGAPASGSAVNLISGSIKDGTGVTTVTVTSTATNAWELSGANTYSGTTTLNFANANGGGAMTFSGSNSSAGATTLSKGILNLNSASNGGLASGTLTLTAGTIQALNATRSLSNAITLQAVTVSGSQSLNFNGKLTGLTGGARTLTNSITGGGVLTLSDVDINTETANPRTLTLAGSANTAVTGVIANGNGTTANGLTITNTGTTTLSGANTYSGTTTMNAAAGTLVLSGTNSSAGATTLTTGTLQLNNASNGGLASGTLTLTAGNLEAVNATRSLSNAITFQAVTVQGGESLNLNGKLTGLSTASRTLTNNIASGKTLTLSDIDINTETANPRTLTIAGSGKTTVTGTIANGNGTTANLLTITNTGTTTLGGANTYSGLTTMNAAAGTLVLSGTNSSAGATTLTTGTLQLNNASNGGLASGTLTLTAGSLQALNAARTLSNPVTLGGSATVSGSQNITFNGKLTGLTGNFRTLTNNITGGTLTLSDIDINTETASARTITFAGSGNTTISGIVANGNGTTANGLVNAGSGTITLTGGNTYTGATTANAGTIVLDATGTAASLASASALTFGGGAFTFKGNNTGTAQTLGAVTVNAGSGSAIKVVAGTSGTTLALGAISGIGLLNINLDNTNGAAVVTNSTTLANDLFSRSTLTVTTGGTTEFATISGGNIVQYTAQTNFVGTGSSASINYKLTGNGQVTATESMNSLRLDTSAAGQSLDLNGKALSLLGSGLLFVGANAYEIKDTGTGATLRGGGSGNSDLNIHNFGTGGLTISSVIINGGGNTPLSLDGPGTTTLSGINTYTGFTYAGGGAVVSIGAYSGLGVGTTNAAASVLTLNNATLRATNTFTLDNGSFSRLITLAANGGTFDVTSGKTLTAPGVISGAGSLTKSGAGTFEVSAVNTYTGATTVNAGTLLVSGSGSINTTTGPIAVTAATAKLRYDSSVALSSNVTVTNGATFAYNSSSNYTGAFTFTNGKLGGTNWNGALAGLTIGANQTITPGNSVGSATSTTQTWAGGGSYDFEINKADGTAGLTAGGWDLLTLSGALNITATTGSKFNLNVISLGLDNLAGNATGFTNTTSYAWLLTDTGATITSFVGTSFAINTTAFTNANSGTWALALGNTGGIGGTDHQLYLTYTGALIPEPSTYAALLGVCGLLLTSVRRRRR